MSKRAAPSVVIDGLYGIHSQGDDAMLLALVGGLRARIPELKVTVLSRDPRQLRHSYRLHAIRNFDHPPFVHERGYWFYGFNPGQPRKHLGAVRETIARADLLLIGGGNLLLDLTHDWLRGPLAWHAITSELAHTYRVPYALFANTIGPFATRFGADRAGAIVRAAIEVGVRDRESFDLARELRSTHDAVHLLPDPALRLRPDLAGAAAALEAAGWKPSARPTIAVSVRDLDWLEDAAARDYLAAMTRICSRAIDEIGVRLIFVPQCTCSIGRVAEDDRGIARSVAAAIDRPERCSLIEEELRPEVTLGIYHHAQAALVTRLHGAVFAAVCGTPALAIAYLPKVRGFLRELGLEDACLSLADLQDTDRALASLERLLSTTEQARATLRAHAASAAARLDAQLDRFADILRRREI